MSWWVDLGYPAFEEGNIRKVRVSSLQTCSESALLFPFLVSSALSDSFPYHVPVSIAHGVS